MDSLYRRMKHTGRYELPKYTRFHASPCRTDNGNLGKFGATNPHGTVFALRQCVCKKEVAGMERIKIHSLCRCKQHTGHYELPKYTRFHASLYMADNGNLGKF